VTLIKILIGKCCAAGAAPEFFDRNRQISERRSIDTDGEIASSRPWSYQEEMFAIKHFGMKAYSDVGYFLSGKRASGR